MLFLGVVEDGDWMFVVVYCGSGGSWWWFYDLV